LFYTYRIWKFSKGLWIVPCITVPLTLAGFGFTYANNSLTLIHNDLAYLPTISYTVYATHGINVFLDIFFVVAMVILLTKERQGFSNTQSMIQRLIMLTINTGLITTVSALLAVIFVRVQPATFVYAVFNCLVSPLYGNSVLANLNSRDYVRGRRDHTIPGSASVELSNWGGTSHGASRVMTANTRVGDYKEGVSISRNIITTQDDKNYPIGGYKGGEV